MSDSKLDEKFVRNVSINSFFHSLLQLRALQGNTGFLKDHYLNIAFQDVAFGLSSLLRGPYIKAALCFSTNFRVFVDDLGDDFVLFTPQRLRHSLTLAAQATANFPEQENLLCESWEYLYACLLDDEIGDQSVHAPYYRYVLTSHSRTICAQLESDRHIGDRLRGKVPSLFNAMEKINSVVVPVNVPLSPSYWQALVDLLSHTLGVSDVVALVAPIFESFQRMVPDGGNAAVYESLCDLIQLIARRVSAEDVVSTTEALLSNIQEEVNRLAPLSNDMQRPMLELLIHLSMQISLSLSPSTNAHGALLQFVMEQVIVQCPDPQLLPHFIEMVIIAIEFTSTTRHQLAPHPDGASPDIELLMDESSWKRYWSDNVEPLVSELLKSFQTSTLLPPLWHDMLELARYHSRVPLPELPSLLVAQGESLEMLHLAGSESAARDIVQLTSFSMLTCNWWKDNSGADGRYIEGFFRQNLTSCFAKLNSISFPSRTSLYELILRMSTLCVGQGLCRMKVFIIHLPKIFQTAATFCTHDGVVDAAQVQAILTATFETISAAALRRTNPEFLMSSVESLIQIAGTQERYLPLIKCVPEKFEIAQRYERLLELEYTLELCKTRLAIPADLVCQRLYTMIASGQRRDLRKLWLILKKEFFSDKYVAFHQLLFQREPKSFSSSEIGRILSIIQGFLPFTENCDQPALQAYSESFLKQVADRLCAISASPKDTLSAQEAEEIQNRLQRIVLYRNIFTDRLEEVTKTYFPSLYPDECASSEDACCEQESEPQPDPEVCKNDQDDKFCSDLDGLLARLDEELGQRMFPSDVIQDDAVMKALLIAAQRIQTVTTERPKYKHVCEYARRTIRYFLTCLSDKEVQVLPPVESMQQRKQMLKQWITELEENQVLIQHLTECGYQRLWEDDLYILIELKLQNNLEEGFYFDILDNYRKLICLLEDLQITELLDSDGDALPVTKASLFPVGMSFADLELRKSLVCQKIKSSPNNYCALRQMAEYEKSELELRQQFFERLRTEKNDRVEETKKFVVQVHNSFFHSVALCSSSGPLAECYSPTGHHAEKPLENALKVNAKFVSIYEYSAPASQKHDESVPIGTVLGEEVENAEVIYTDQGIYFYRAYSRGHAYNTSEIWATFMKALLTNEYVPAVVLSPGFPSSRCFDYISNYVTPEIYPTILNYRDDFFSREGISSYYDSLPQKVNIGDIVITPEKANSLPLPLATVIGADEGGFMRSSSAPLMLTQPLVHSPAQVESSKSHVRERKKDFCGHVISECISQVQVIESFQPYKNTLHAWARPLSEFVSNYLQTGRLDSSILNDGFDLKLFNAKAKKSQKKKKKTIAVLTAKDKQIIIDQFIGILSATMNRYYDMDDEELQNLYQTNRAYFYDLRLHLQRLSRVSTDGEQVLVLRRRLQQMRETLLNRCGVVSIVTLPMQTQEQLIRWCFWNEDKVWRYRGERTENTVQDFLSFVHPPHLSPYPGLCITRLEEAPTPTQDLPVSVIHEQLPSLAACEERVVAYLVGEFTDESTYEIVTAWTDTKMGSLGLAVTMYSRVMEELYFHYGCRTLVLDIRKGSYDQIVASSPVFQWLCRLGWDRHIVRLRKDSYEQRLQGGAYEYFERLELELPPLAHAIRAMNWMQRFLPSRASPQLSSTSMLHKSPEVYSVEAPPPPSGPSFSQLLLSGALSRSVFVASIAVPLFFAFSSKNK